MPFLVHIFPGGKRKRVHEQDNVLSVSNNNKRRTNNAAARRTSAITTSPITAYRRNHSQDAGKEGDGGRFNLQGAVDPHPPRHEDPSTTTTVGVLGTTTTRTVTNGHNKKCDTRTDDVVPSCHSSHAEQNHNHVTRPQNCNFNQWCPSSPSASSSRRNPINSNGGTVVANKYGGNNSDHFNDNTRTANTVHCSGKVSGFSLEDVVANTTTNNHASTTVTTKTIIRQYAPNPESFRSKHSAATFEERCNQLVLFKEEFGHCKVPKNYKVNPSLGHWCNAMKSAYNKIQQGLKTDRNLPPDRIKRLEEIGLKWRDKFASFDKHCHDLVEFKKEFGHCNVPTNYKSLGSWCCSLRTAYRGKQKGNKIRMNLSPGIIERLEEIGFKWEI